MSVELLSRLQFAGTIMFHYLFPPLTIGLGLIMVLLEFQWLRTRDMGWNRAARFWTRIFALNFALGVSTGIVMEFEFGTNWATYSRYVGDVFGSALAAEGIFAFFLESGFLGVVVFGWERVSKGFHYFATCMVCMGGFFSSIWIVIANSFMQTPAGFHLVEHPHGVRAEITDFWAMVFNPSSLDRLVHVWFGSFILGAFFALSIASFYVLRDRHSEVAPLMVKISLAFATLWSTLMLVSGDSNARMVARQQPAKMAAFEALFKTTEGATGFWLVGWPDAEKETVTGVEVPALLSLLVHRDLTTPVAGLDKIPADERPPIWLPFQAYHLMIGLGTAFIGLSWLGCFFWWRGTLFEQRWLLWLFVLSVLGAYAANEAGWVAAEVGRQPWVVYGLLRTDQGLSQAVVAGQVLSSILMFGLVYFLLFLVWVFVMNNKISHGPEALDEGPSERENPLAVAATRYEEEP
ncbi:MAG: cytochrome ubiquinol oxidase subunit I [Candidatus Eremiobacteraeota bacterium]|nr:cytochrome ubiquinol oxidase subunit I [Candidatus Eremiobacteraeota bacterium]